MAKRPSEAIKKARAYTRYKPKGMCLKWVRTTLGIGARYPSAITAWNAVPKKDRRTSWPPPAGYPVFFRGGRHGHIALSMGNGICRSTDVPRAEAVSNINIKTLASRWRYRYLGWSTSLNGVAIPADARPAPKRPSSVPTVDWSSLKHAAKIDPPRPGHLVYYPSGVNIVEAALVRAGLLNKKYADSRGHFGSATKTAYSKWQRRLGYVGRDADGLPGMSSLIALGKKYGFKVKR